MKTQNQDQNQDEADLISVIVPVYNVEKYLDRCMKSILQQTYHRLEIILVDDGSTDASAAMCDAYARRDSRIRVVHKQNGGLSDARNAGLELAAGDYIGYVDSDDWIEPDMYEYLLENALKYQADIAVCGRVERYVDKEVVRGFSEIEVLAREPALKYLLQNDLLQNYAWDKLYKQELFQDL